MDTATAQALRDAAKTHLDGILPLLVELPTDAANAAVLAAGAVQHIPERRGNIAPRPESFALTVGHGDLPTSHDEDIAAKLSRFTAANLGVTLDSIARAQAHRREKVTAERGRLRAGRFLRRATLRRLAADHVRDALEIMEELPIAARSFDGVFAAICDASGIVIVADGFTALDPRGRAVAADPLDFGVESLRVRTTANAARLAGWRERWLDAVWAAIDTGTDDGAEAEVAGPAPDAPGPRRARATAAQRATEVRDARKREDADAAQRKADRAARLVKHERKQEAKRAAAREEARRHLRAMGYGTSDAKIKSDSELQKVDDGFDLSR